MLSCWQPIPADRPTFNDLRSELACLLTAPKDENEEDGNRRRTYLGLMSSSAAPNEDSYLPMTAQRQQAREIESGDSSVVTRWTVDQEVVGSNPTHGGNLISVVRSLSEFTQPIR